jgi:soluble lytic murein transglycosylase-like protein
MDFIINALIEYHARLEGVDPALVRAVAYVESKYDPHALSPKGARGVMQVMPINYNGDPDKLYNLSVNIPEGIRLLKKYSERCKHQIDFTWLVCYNRGATGGARIEEPLKDSYYLKVRTKYSLEKLK